LALSRKDTKNPRPPGSNPHNRNHLVTVAVAVEAHKSKGFGRIRLKRIAALIKRWFLGTHQGTVDPRHVDYYLDEFTFRFNRRTSRSRGMLFYRLIQQSVVAPPATYANIRDNHHSLRVKSDRLEAVELNG
jgi:ISXO2-like transposase domain